MAKKKFVGFGFGPIQAGLMVYEAINSGNFDSFIIAEIDQKLVDAVRRNHDRVSINVATEKGIVSHELSGVRLFNPKEYADRQKIAKAIAEGDELATAVPSVGLYSAGGEGSVASLIAGNLNPAKQQLLYASENNNYAAELLAEAIRKLNPQADFSKFQILNTVIGKMSGVKQSAGEIEKHGLTPVIPGWDRAILVETFNRILVSRVKLPGFERGISVFEEKDDLLPFEEAKLYGHNAIHSLLGYSSHELGYSSMSQVRGDSGLMRIGRRAFLDESGAALIAKHGHTGDPLFTPAGFTAYAEDLLTRMTNPYLLDDVARVIRDPVRKLGYDDRFFGTMRQAFGQNIAPRLLAQGAATAIRYYASQDTARTDVLNRQSLAELLNKIWANEKRDEFEGPCIELVAEALEKRSVSEPVI